VKSDWLYDSIEKGYCLEEQQFSLTENSNKMSDVKTSTPEKENGSRGMVNSTKSIVNSPWNLFDIEW
jgi:hypothetical protein